MELTREFIFTEKGSAPLTLNQYSPLSGLEVPSSQDASANTRTLKIDTRVVSESLPILLNVE